MVQEITFSSILKLEINAPLFKKKTTELILFLLFTLFIQSYYHFLYWMNKTDNELTMLHIVILSKRYLKSNFPE